MCKCSDLRETYYVTECFICQVLQILYCDFKLDLLELPCVFYYLYLYVNTIVYLSQYVKSSSIQLICIRWYTCILLQI